MRIYSNKLLSWPQIIHVSQAARLHSGKWLKYYFYNIQSVKPLEIHTHSPLQLLAENRYYYCYDNNVRSIEKELSGNYIIFLDTELRTIYYPVALKSGDFMVIQDDSHPTINSSPSSKVIPYPLPFMT